jgi:uncharacterized membrane protein YeaQ/YmgE (transglycosylase-associated protein family)
MHILNFDELKKKWLLILMGMVVGAAIGSLLHHTNQAGGIISAITYGAIIGLIVSFIVAAFQAGRHELQIATLQLSVPQCSQITFLVNNEYRKLAWKLFVETITRVSTQPLGGEEGYIREALNSLYELFTTTRALLKEISPCGTEKGYTVEMYAITMLNQQLRPFLSKWHPALAAFERNYPNQAESEWDLQSQCRAELEQLQGELVWYSKGLAELAGIKQIEFYFRSKD